MLEMWYTCPCVIENNGAADTMVEWENAGGKSESVEQGMVSPFASRVQLWISLTRSGER